MPVRQLILVIVTTLVLARSYPSVGDTGTSPAGTEPTFATEGSGFLQKHCLSCHSGDKAKADLRLDKYRDEAAVIKDRKTWQRVLDVLQSGEMPPPSKPRPGLAEVENFTKLIGLIFKQHDESTKPDPGRVTMRRLNRNEYNYTIRDLVGIDFNPAEDFPSDDVGHGFDNIGDVLTLPPVLLERYLAAAESIMDRAITPNPPRPPNRGVATQYTEPAGPNVPMKGNFRVVSGRAGGTPIETGPIFTRYQVPADGEYIAHTQVYVETSGSKPVKVALLAGCSPTCPLAAKDAEADTIAGAAAKGLRPFVILKTFEVKARNESAAEHLQAAIPAGIGPDKVAVALVKPEDGEPAPTLYVKFLSLEGPLDTRPASHRRLLACDPNKPEAERTREVLGRFASRAYRRPVTAEELDRLVALAESRRQAGEKWEAAIQFAMTAVLVSPKFLFRVELDDRPDSPDPHPLDEYQLASRLSYFLWSSMPDQELFDLAANKQLTPNLDSQVKRMLRDPKAAALVDHFVMQWLQLQRLSTAQPDPKLFPEFNDQLRSAMLRETKLFFTEIIREDRSVLDILAGNFSYLNAPLARLYGIADTAGNKIASNPKDRKPGGKPFKPDEFSRVDMTGTGRGGILTQASFLTVTSNPTRTSPVKRGRWVLEQLLGTPPPPPPPNVPELEENGKPLTSGSLRARMEEHRKNPACASCHAKMDPLGFGLENFNAIGAYRSKDGEFPIDASGELPGGLKFTGPEQLRQVLLTKKDQFARCLAEKMLTYALGRGLEYYDRRAIDRIVADLAAADYRFSALVTGIVKSDPFRLRRGRTP